MSVNKVILLGHVGGDPELRFPEKDVAVAYFSLATNERYGSSQTEITEWHNIVVTGQNARLAERYPQRDATVSGREASHARIHRPFQDSTQTHRDIR